eukprot:TRINITY_DN625_c0_g2_i3.p1 TRINITY_DN625_c0_g2~~TRINITY_DN625_c0_g2_i3.p1  ORF type:complete len:362 (+),score=51.05 TRINITY_DN625_c0_g2_i3:59-1144(+)
MPCRAGWRSAAAMQFVLRAVLCGSAVATAQATAAGGGARVRTPASSPAPARSTPIQWAMAPVGNPTESDDVSVSYKSGSSKTGGTPFLKPNWGYDKWRNYPRWELIHKEIHHDGSRTRRISVVDYGSDQGFFSVSTAYAFPNAEVISVELGDAGGSGWSRGKMDVLWIQERKIRAYRVQPRVVICQTRLNVGHFADLLRSGVTHDYQYVLSVFHWFPMVTRAEFEKVLVTMLRNARTTFIELPPTGDHPNFKNQIGWHRFVRWYDGRTDVGQVIKDALHAQHVPGKVRLLGRVQWMGKGRYQPVEYPRGNISVEGPWARELYRVDVQQQTPPGGNCRAHHRIYGCRAETTPRPVRYSNCRQ